MVVHYNELSKQRIFSLIYKFKIEEKVQKCIARNQYVSPLKTVNFLEWFMPQRDPKFFNISCSGFKNRVLWSSRTQELIHIASQ